MTRRRLDIKIQRREYENDGKTARRHDVYIRMTYVDDDRHNANKL
jgi:hypothetical protein